MTTYCEDCDHIHPDTRGSEPWRWRCTKVPVPGGYRFVSRTYSPDPPYARCDQVNTDGDCAMFEPIPHRDDTEQPKTKQYEHHKRILEATHR